MTERDYRVEEISREFDGWYEAQGWPNSDREDLAEAFAAGMEAQVYLDDRLKGKV